MNNKILVTVLCGILLFPLALCDVVPVPYDPTEPVANDSQPEPIPIENKTTSEPINPIQLPTNDSKQDIKSKDSPKDLPQPQVKNDDTNPLILGGIIVLVLIVISFLLLRKFKTKK